MTAPPPKARTSSKAKAGLTYAQAGVDIEAGDAMVGLIKQHMRRTYGPRVLGKHGAFAGMFRLDYNEKLFQRNYRDPVLVACTDGVGSKVMLASKLGIYGTVGIDLVAMSVNDLIVQAAEPLFFLDYLAVHKLDPQQSADMVKGVSDGCMQAGCALLGGETAEMPDTYAPGEFDMAGFAVGVVELSRALDGSRVESGDVILGLASNGVHSNGYSLVRKVIEHAGLSYDAVYPEAQPPDEQPRTLGQLLMEPTRIYAKAIVSVLRKYKVKQVISGMSHITGGGLPGNVNRALPDDCNAKLDRKAWTVPPLFRFLQEKGNVAEDEMLRVFNMGIGFVAIVRPHFADSVVKQLRKQGEDVCVLGKVVKGSGKVVWK